MKIITITFDDILLDHQESAAKILTACKRSKLTVAGICELSNAIAVLLLPALKNEPEYSLVFAKITAEDDEEKISEISSRYHNGFDIIGTFFIDDNQWALYKRRKK